VEHRAAVEGKGGCAGKARAGAGTGTGLRRGLYWPCRVFGGYEDDAESAMSTGHPSDKNGNMEDPEP
jgi:hypothetical protein